MLLTPDQREQQDRHSAAFRNFILHGVNGMNREDVEVLRAATVQNAQSGQQANGAQGGFLVPNGWGAELLEALARFGGMRDVATVMPTAGGNPIPWPTVDETAVEGEIVPENTQAGAGDFTFGTTQIGAYKFSSKIVAIPFELLQDQGPGIDIEGFTRRALATRIARITNRLFTTGGKVVLDEAKARTNSHEVEEGLVMKTRREAGRVIVKVTVKRGWAYSLAIWEEYGTAAHFITVDDSQRQGMSVKRVNDQEKKGSLVIGGHFVGRTVHHPGTPAAPFLRPSLDVKGSEAIAAAQSYINSRVRPSGIVASAEPEDDDA